LVSCKQLVAFNNKQKNALFRLPCSASAVHVRIWG